MSKPVLAMGLLAVAAGAWYWALLPPVAPATTAAPRRAGRDGTTPFPRVHLERLAQPRRPPPAVALRDPFRATGAGAPSSLARQAAARPASAAGEAAVVVPPAWPHLELIGLAEAREGAGLVRTAIVSGPHGVHHARPGEMVEQVYRLERIGADGAELRLVPEDRLVRLVLRP